MQLRGDLPGGWLAETGGNVRSLGIFSLRTYLQRWAVSKRVNSSKADKDDATLIEPVMQAA